MKHTYLIDAGHGGMINGKYQTAPAKMYDHGNGHIFYEGVSNREFATDLMKEFYSLGIPYIDVTGTQLDIPLDVRVRNINELYRQYPNAVLLSIHSNAGKGRGLEVWTSVGQTRSDKFAESLCDELLRSFPELPFRKDIQDGDLDKEAHFYILKHTDCPAVLPEFLFYDNWEDYKLLVDTNFRKRYIQALIRWAQTCDTLNI